MAGCLRYAARPKFTTYYGCMSPMDSTTPSFSFTPNPAPVSPERRAELMANPGFGRVFTDHMATVSYTEGRGWHDAKVMPYGPLSLDPASSVLHYAQEIFEGLKAYRTPEGSVVMFRPDANARRFRDSAARMAMAELPEELFVGAIEALVRADRDWVPSGEGQSLYLRPFMISNDVFLGVKPASEYLFCVIACPVGAYFGGGCVSVWVSETYTRAAPGGTGAAKCGGNYAASLQAQAESKREGCDQVLFLDSREQRYVEEMGGMNVVFVDGDTLVTPPLGGTILPGITRDTLLTLARARGLKVEERPLPIDEVFEKAASGQFSEAFACGTAAVISPIGKLRRPTGEAVFGDGVTPGALSLSLKDELVGLQTGRGNDANGWVHRIL